ncbi:MAG: flavodoxin domain-containing protein [Defluviitaleaceae bacterium]|nr:flavodoxin domain-containing protein [Defluviitaleaceae bacterium]MCL2836909.1 flavodoxin domain-containing protein [Defluviitaleaceae bacterium]
MDVVVIYNSKTGFTKKYAEWIAEELSCDTLPYKDFTNTAADGYDVVIFGSRVHAGSIEHLKKIKTHFADNPNQKLVVFATGGTPAAAEEVINKIWNNNLSEAEIKSIPHFYIQSGLDYGKMNFLDRTIMKSAAMILSKVKNKNDDEAGFEQAIKNSYDSSSKDYIMPLVSFVKGYIAANQGFKRE